MVPRFQAQSRDLVQMTAERGIPLAHTTILRWVQRYVPDFEKRWQAYARPVGDSWHVDETYLKIKGQCVYLDRAVDKAGRTVDFLLSRRRDMSAAKRFFSRATKQFRWSIDDYEGTVYSFSPGAGMRKGIDPEKDVWTVQEPRW
jgi:transposase-like protein